MKPQCLAYDSNSAPLNGGPLSLFKTSGMPWRENMASNFGRTAFAETVVSTSTSGNRLNSSIITRRYSPVGKGPQKSVATSFQGAHGRWVILSGSGGGWLPEVAAWQERHARMVSSTIVSILGNQTFERSKHLVLMIP